MVPTKKPLPSPPAGNPKSTPNPSTVVRHVIPSLSPLPGDKPAAPNVQAGTPAAITASSEKSTQPATADLQPTSAPAPASKTAEVIGEKAATPGEASSEKATTDSKSGDSQATEKPAEKLGPKIRTRGAILTALRAGAKIEKIDNLYRIVNQNGSKNATSKRRILSLESQKLLVGSADGNSFTLDVAADKQAQEPKAAPAVKESVKDAK